MSLLISLSQNDLKEKHDLDEEDKEDKEDKEKEISEKDKEISEKEKDKEISEKEISEKDKGNKNVTHSIPPSVPIVDVENDIEINLISSSSDSYVQSEEEEKEEKENANKHPENTQTTVELFSQSSFESTPIIALSPIAPKKSIKRMITHSPISNKVYKSASFSPSSRMKIYQNETRLSSLLNGY